MLVALEKSFLILVRDFYSLDFAIGIAIPGLIALGLVLLQMTKQGTEKFVVSCFAGIFGMIAFLFLVRDQFVLKALNRAIAEYDSALVGTSPIPILEPLFHLLIGPADQRTVPLEILGVALFSYLGMVLFYGFMSFKETGKIIGNFSFAGFGSSKPRRPKRSMSNELGSGDLANNEQILEWTRPSGKDCDTVLDVTDLRGSEGIALKSGKLIIPNDVRNRHILIVAKTGGGKTTKLILPVLYNDVLDPKRSTIVLDSKPEMWAKLAGLARKYNPEKKIILFNPLDTVRSLSWNILSKIDSDTDAKLIANTIIQATDQPGAKGDSPFFRNNALAILNAIMVGLLHDPNDQLSMPRIHEIVQSGMKSLGDWLEARPHAIRTTRTFVELARSGSQNADTIMSELSMRLSAWDLKAIRATTAFDELDVENLVSHPTLFIVELRESELEMLRPMANVIVVELLRWLTKRAESCPGNRLPRPVSFVIDEFASALGRLPDIHVKLNTLRSRNVSIVAAIQSIGQIKANYQDHADSVISGFSTKIFMPPIDITDSEWASKETGQMTIRFQTASKGSNKKLTEVFASKNDSSNEQVQQRAVLTPDEIGKPVDNINTFFMPNSPTFQGFLTPYYQLPEMLKRVEESEQYSNFSLREGPIDYEEKMPEVAPAAAGGGGGGAGGGTPPGISDTRGWDETKVREVLADTKKKIDWDNTTGSARKWWEAFENENQHRVALILRLAEELAVRSATITEFFLAYVYSNTDNIQANLCYLDYTRLKKEEEKRKREAAAASESKGPESEAA